MPKFPGWRPSQQTPTGVPAKGIGQTPLAAGPSDAAKTLSNEQLQAKTGQGAADVVRMTEPPTEGFVRATLKSFPTAISKVDGAIDKLGGQIGPAELNRILGRLDKLQADLSTPGLGAVAVDAGKIGDIRGAVVQLGEAYAKLEAKLADVKFEPASKLSGALGDLVKGQLGATDLAEYMRADVPDLEKAGVTGQMKVDLGDQVEDLKRVGWAHYNKGKLAKAAGQDGLAAAHFEGAIDNLKRMSKMSSDNAVQTVAANRLGMVHHQMGEETRAIGYYDIALALNGEKYPPGHFNQASSWLALGQMDAALEQIELSVKNTKSPDDAEMMRGLAAKDSDLAGLIGEPRYQALVGDCALTKDVSTDTERPVFKTDAWIYKMDGAKAGEFLEAMCAALAAQVKANTPEGGARPSASLHGPGGLIVTGPAPEDPRQGLRYWAQDEIDPTKLAGQVLEVMTQEVDGPILRDACVGTIHFGLDGNSFTFNVQEKDKLAIDPWALHCVAGPMSELRGQDTPPPRSIMRELAQMVKSGEYGSPEMAAVCELKTRADIDDYLGVQIEGAQRYGGADKGQEIGRLRTLANARAPEGTQAIWNELLDKHLEG